MRRLKRNFRKNRNKIILTTAFALVFCLCVGYAAFQTVINFNVKGNIKKKLLTPRDLTKNVVTTGDGLYADTTEEGRYIYRGANPNNYITLGSDMYRIISVESDNTLKVIKNGSIGTKAFDEKNARYSTNSTDYCTSKNGCKVWGSKATMLDTNGKNVTQMPREVGGTLYNLPDKEASLNTYLNSEWYSLLDSSFRPKIVTHLFNVGVTKIDEDSFTNTVSQEKAYKWRGKVGILSTSDYVRASVACKSVRSATYYNGNIPVPSNPVLTSVSTSDSDSSWGCFTHNYNSNWIYKAIDNSYKTGETKEHFTSLQSDSASDSIIVASLADNGVLFLEYVSRSDGVTPVFYLSSDIILTGSGTESDPYILKE
ncbi:MAG: hypothetical protein PUA73_02885 [Bacilli bacterium]|nr:hypothetical protein [Bacilli bacterium]